MGLAVGGDLSGTINNATVIKAERIPTQMVFTEISPGVAWFDPTVSNNSRLCAVRTVDDPFTDTTQTRFTPITESQQGTIGISGGQFTLTNNSGASSRMTLVYENTAPALLMPQLFTSVDVVNRTGSNGAYAAILLGLVKDGNNYFVINWNMVDGTLTIQTKISGSSDFYSQPSLSVSFTTTLGLQIVGNWVTIWYYRSGTWTKHVSVDITSHINFKSTDLSSWYPCFGFATPNTVTNTATFDNFRVGRFGGVGIRDICVVTHQDGSPYYSTTPSIVKALGTLAGPTNGITEASMGVFDIDLEKKTVTQTGLVMTNRSSTRQNDHAGQIIVEDNGDQHFVVSTWGDLPTPTRVHYGFQASGTDLLTGSHIVSTSQLNLTELPSGGGQYDPFLIKKGATWYLAYTATSTGPNTFYPALDSSANLASWSNVGKDAASLRYEGTRILPFNSQSFVLTGGQSNMRMYDLTMTYIGLVNCMPIGDGTTQPHAMIFPYNGLNILVTFDQTTWPNPGGVSFSWGSVRWFASPRY
jgi:hypothetical protein